MKQWIAPGLKIAQTPGEDILIVTRMNREPECAPREFNSFCIRGTGPTMRRLYDWLVGKELSCDCDLNPAHIIEFANDADRDEMERVFADYIRDYPSLDDQMRDYAERMNAKSA